MASSCSLVCCGVGWAREGHLVKVKVMYVILVLFQTLLPLAMECLVIKYVYNFIFMFILICFNSYHKIIENILQVISYFRSTFFLEWIMYRDIFGAKRVVCIYTYRYNTHYISKQSFYYEIVIVEMIFRNYFVLQWLCQCNARHVDGTKAVSMNFQLEIISCQSHNKTYNRETYQSRIDIKCTFHFWYFKLFQYSRRGKWRWRRRWRRWWRWRSFVRRRRCWCQIRGICQNQMLSIYNENEKHFWVSITCIVLNITQSSISHGIEMRKESRNNKNGYK